MCTPSHLHTCSCAALQVVFRCIVLFLLLCWRPFGHRELRMASWAPLVVEDTECISTGLAVDPAASHIGMGYRLCHKFSPLSESGFTGFRDFQDNPFIRGSRESEFPPTVNRHFS